MKIVSSGKGIHTPGFHKKKLRKRRVRIVLGALILIIIISVPVFFLRQKRFQISTVQIQGNEVTKSEEIENIARQGLAGKYLWLIPRSSVLLYPKNQIKTDILKQIPRLISANLSLIDSGTLLVTIIERKPFALYCADTNLSTLSNDIEQAGCFFLDKSGYIFSEAPDFSDGVYVIYSKEPALESPLSQILLPETNFMQVYTFLKNLESLGIQTKTFLIKDDEYHITLPTYGVISFKTSADLDKVHSNLETFLSDKNIVQDKNVLENILYIDLRFDNKIFYKFR